MLSEGRPARADGSYRVSAQLTEGVHTAATAEALQRLWWEVAGTYEAPPGHLRRVDYDACLAALSTGVESEQDE